MPNFLSYRLAKNSRHRFQREQTRVFLSLLAQRYENALDVGCGKGFFSYVGAREGKFKNLFACDVYRDYQEKEISPLVSYIEYRGIEKNRFPFEDGKFDLVFSLDVIEHVEDDELFLHENFRVCKSGGQIIIGTPNYWRITNSILRAFGKLHYPRVMGHDSYGPVTHIREYTKDDLHVLLANFSNQMNRGIRVIPCWYGIMQWNIGFDSLPKIFERYCQFWFVVLTKK